MQYRKSAWTKWISLPRIWNQPWSYDVIYGNLRSSCPRIENHPLYTPAFQQSRGFLNPFIFIVLIQPGILIYSRRVLSAKNRRKGHHIVIASSINRFVDPDWARGWPTQWAGGDSEVFNRIIYNSWQDLLTPTYGKATLRKSKDVAA